jgi:hypothetical protein
MVVSVMFQKLIIRIHRRDNIAGHIQRCTNALRSAGAFRVVRRLEIDSRLQELPRVPPEAALAAIENSLKCLIRLSDFVYSGFQISPIVLETLSNYLPSCRLHLASFPCKYFGQTPFNDIKLAKVPNLQSPGWVGLPAMDWP